MQETNEKKMPIANLEIKLPSGLWIVATPIGNLYDLTARASEALKRANLVLCEDTRRTLILLKYLNLSKQLVRFDAHSNSYKLCKIIDVLQQGKNIALVTDAGTPCISDPGANLVNEAHKAGILVTPVAGVSALSTFLSVSGIHENGFCFRGFFPRKPSEQQKELKQVSESLFCHFYVW
ncbi:MAG: rRNA small subunit methyltransferase 1, partial [Deltaproteobacteria bacterium]|nr:rRNA small subunit methyltransferase 1 [Deltaproteobacteria bacterium]